VRVAREPHRLGLAEDLQEVLRVDVPRCDDFRRVARMVDRGGGFHEYDLYDVDLRFSHQFLLERQSFPLARVEAETLRPLEEQWGEDYDPLPLRVARLDVEIGVPRGTVPGMEHAICGMALTVQGREERCDGREAEALDWLQQSLQELDPDVLVTRGGDRFLLQYLRDRAERHGITLQLGRAPDPARPVRAEKSYVSYGHMKYQPRVEALRGRVHLDGESSFFYGEAGLHGLVDLARIASVPLQELARLTAGTVVTGIQIDRAKRENRLVPFKKNIPEAPKTELELLAADRGGYIFDSLVGLHGPVVELDFSSMYPSIMVTRNVSPETINCACCTVEQAQSIVPQVGYRTCRKSGFVGRALAPLVQRREAMKRRMKAAQGEERERCQAACDAMKWLAVCSFGYQGYRNARFGRIECHEAICAWGRELLLQASGMAREHGFEVLHGIVDSVWLQPFHPSADAEAFAQAATHEIGIPLGVEGWYDWIVFLPNRTGASDPWVGPVGAMNRFYGCFRERPTKKSRSQAGQPLDYLDGGRVKVRGVELRQHSAPGIVREAQGAFLLEVAKARSPAEFRERLPRALRSVRPVLRRLQDGAASADELLITCSVQQEEELYRANTLVRAALKGLKAAGVRVAPGDSVTYLVTDAQAERLPQRVKEARLLRGREAYDAAFYRKLVLRSVESLVLPFGWTQERLALLYEGQEQRTLLA
jgi:DNA polymerase elongation subunit (family B)